MSGLGEQPRAGIAETVRRAWGLLDRRSQRRWLALVPLTVLAALFEVIGALLIFTLIKQVNERAEVERYARWLRAITPGEGPEALILAFAGVVALFTVIK